MLPCLADLRQHQNATGTWHSGCVSYIKHCEWELILESLSCPHMPHTPQDSAHTPSDPENWRDAVQCLHSIYKHITIRKPVFHVTDRSSVTQLHFNGTFTAKVKISSFTEESLIFPLLTYVNAVHLL
jgi:hypothetical protein